MTALRQNMPWFVRSMIPHDDTMRVVVIGSRPDDYIEKLDAYMEVAGWSRKTHNGLSANRLVPAQERAVMVAYDHGGIKYGCDAYRVPLVCEPGWALVEEGDTIMLGDRVFDVYSGWEAGHDWNAINNKPAKASGIWTGWARRIE